MAADIIIMNATHAVTNSTAVVQQQDFITTIFNAPYLWAIIGLGVVCFTILKLSANKKKETEDPFYGEKLRKKKTQEQFKTRTKVWGIKTNLTLFKGFLRVGKVFKIEPVNRLLYVKNKRGVVTGEKQELEYYNIAFRGFGFWNWVKCELLGKYEHMLIDPVVTKIDLKKKTLEINPKSFVMDDSGVWTQVTKKEMELVDELNLKKDVENVKGFTTAFVQKVANLNPSVASENEKATHNANLEEQSKKNRISRFAGGN